MTITTNGTSKLNTMKIKVMSGRFLMIKLSEGILETISYHKTIILVESWMKSAFQQKPVFTKFLILVWSLDIRWAKARS